MDAQTVISFIQGVGFPIVMCGAMAYYVKYTQDKFLAQLDGQNERHKKEIDTVIEAVNNNTKAILNSEKTLAILTHELSGKFKVESEG